MEELSRLTKFKGSSTDKKLGREQAGQIKRILGDLTALCFMHGQFFFFLFHFFKIPFSFFTKTKIDNEEKENNAEHQRILANVSAHEAVVDVLHLPASRFQESVHESAFDVCI